LTAYFVALPEIPPFVWKNHSSLSADWRHP